MGRALMLSSQLWHTESMGLSQTSWTRRRSWIGCLTCHRACSGSLSRGFISKIIHHLTKYIQQFVKNLTCWPRAWIKGYPNQQKNKEQSLWMVRWRQMIHSYGASTRRTKMAERQTFVLIKHPVSLLYKAKLPWQNNSAIVLNPNTQVGSRRIVGFK